MIWPFTRKKPVAVRHVPPLVRILESVLSTSVHLLQEFKDERSAHEGILYWCGKDYGSEWIVTTCFLPDAKTTRGSFETSSKSNADMIAFLAANDLQLLGQVHSHPGESVGHSDGDDRGALMPYEFYLSIVVPFYGRRG